MTLFKLLSAASIAAVTLATPGDGSPELLGQRASAAHQHSKASAINHVRCV
jgi:hypothetical protein